MMQKVGKSWKMENPPPAKLEAGLYPINRIGAGSLICHEAIAQSAHVDQISGRMSIIFNGLPQLMNKIGRAHV